MGDSSYRDLGEDRLAYWDFIKIGVTPLIMGMYISHYEKGDILLYVLENYNILLMSVL